MQSHTSKGKHTSFVSHTSPTPPSSTVTRHHQSANKAPDQKRKWNVRKDVRLSPMLFSDSEDDLSSDTQSYDMDDLYGSDSGIETFSLTSYSDAQVRMTSKQTVCNFPNYTHSGLSQSSRMVIRSHNLTGWR